MKNISIKAVSNYFRSRKRHPMGRHRHFSVLVPFIEIDGELYLLFEKRAEREIMSPGEICFPGGHMEEGESAGRCAFRETEEELGIPAERIRFIGRGDTLTGFSGFSLYTTMGQISYEDYLSMTPDKDEVEEGFIVKVSEFMEKKPYVFKSDVIADREGFPYEYAGISPDYPWSTGTWETVIYHVNDGIDAKGKERIVWGLTGGIVRYVMDQLEEAIDVYR